MSRKPACMDAEEHAAWTEMNDRLWITKALTPCSDCVMGFALEMRAIDMCDGEPGVQPTKAELRRRHSATLRARKAARMARTLELATAGYRQATIVRLTGYGRSTVSRYLREAAA